MLSVGFSSFMSFKSITTCLACPSRRSQAPIIISSYNRNPSLASLCLNELNFDHLRLLLLGSDWFNLRMMSDIVAQSISFRCWRYLSRRVCSWYSRVLTSDTTASMIPRFTSLTRRRLRFIGARICSRVNPNRLTRMVLICQCVRSKLLKRIRYKTDALLALGKELTELVLRRFLTLR